MKKPILYILCALFVPVAIGTWVGISMRFDQPALKQDMKDNKDMTQISFTPEQAIAMSAIARNEAQGNQNVLYIAINRGLDAGLTVSQIKEALSHLYAYTGFPRSLNALGTLQKVLAERTTPYEQGTEPLPLPKDFDALQQGTQVQTMLTGQPFTYSFAPATDYYLKAHLFGDIFARDNLTYADRELITVSALSAMHGVEPQLAAHIAGARNMGVPEEVLQQVLAVQADNAVDLKSSWPMGKPNDAYAQYFTGRSYLQPMAGGVANVTFEPRCRNNWHIHHGAVQVLVCVYGRGWYQEEGKPAVPLKEGTVIAIPEGVKHWHGAAQNSWMQHLAYHIEQQPDASNEWLEPVSDEQYNQLP